MSEHPLEVELQEFANGKSENHSRIKMHVDSCKECSAMVQFYQFLFSMLQQQEKPEFDFDLNGLVLQKIQAPKLIPAKDNLVFYIIGFVVICSAGAALYWYREFVYGVFQNFDSLFIALLTSTATLTMIFLVMDIYFSYQRKIKALDFY